MSRRRIRCPALCCHDRQAARNRLLSAEQQTPSAPYRAPSQRSAAPARGSCPALRQSPAAVRRREIARRPHQLPHQSDLVPFALAESASRELAPNHCVFVEPAQRHPERDQADLTADEQHHRRLVPGRIRRQVVSPDQLGANSTPQADDLAAVQARFQCPQLLTSASTVSATPLREPSPRPGAPS